MGNGQSRQRRYSEEFKKDAVALLRSSGRPVAEVARELGITDTSLGNWAREAVRREGGRPKADPDAEEVRQLRKRIKQLEDELEILKRFTTYWVSETGR
jgi:transposase